MTETDIRANLIAVQERIAEFNAQGDGQAITIKLGVHSGPCIAVTLNDRLDYFGSTVNLAARLQGQSIGGDIVLSADVMAEPGVRDLLRGRGPLVEQRAELRGFARPVAFFRLIAPAAQKTPTITPVNQAASSGAASS